MNIAQRWGTIMHRTLTFQTHLANGLADYKKNIGQRKWIFPTANTKIVETLSLTSFSFFNRWHYATYLSEKTTTKETIHSQIATKYTGLKSPGDKVISVATNNPNWVIKHNTPSIGQVSNYIIEQSCCRCVFDDWWNICYWKSTWELNRSSLLLLTLPMLRLLSLKTQGCKKFGKPSKLCCVCIHWRALAEYSQISTHMPVFLSFSGVLHHFVLAILGTSSIRVNPSIYCLHGNYQIQRRWSMKTILVPDPWHYS